MKPNFTHPTGRPHATPLKSLLLAGAALIAGAQASVAQPAHLLNGLTLVTQIYSQQSQGIFTDSEGAQINRYGGSWEDDADPSFIRFGNPIQGVMPGNNTTCAPFVTHLLLATYNWNWGNVVFFDPILNSNHSCESPSSYRYVAMIKQNAGFVAQLPTLNLVQPGDIMALQDVGANTGHTTIVVQVDWLSGKAYPSQLPGADGTLAGSTYYEVEVLDSSSGQHSSDTRTVTLANNTKVITSGAGVGRMGVLVNGNFEVLGHTWSLPTANYATKPATWLSGFKSRFRPQSNREMVFGRLPALNVVP